MDKLKRFGPILMFVLIAGLCAAFVNWFYEVPKEVLAEKRYDINLVTINSKLGSKNVDSGYAYSAERAAELKKVPEQVEANVTRPSRTLDDKIGVFVAYPMPTRPRSDEVIPDKEPVNVYAAMKPLTKVSAHPDQGAVFLQFDIPEPKSNTLMELVRVEVFRGKDEKSIDMTKPIGTVELGPEEPVTAAAAGTAAVPVAAEKERVRGVAAPVTPATKKTAAVVVPKYTKAFRDSNVEQKSEYFYKLRLVGRFTSTEGKFEPNKKADGSIAPGPGFKMHAPEDKNYAVVTPKSPGSTALLFALPPTETVHSTTPSNFNLRLEGITGTLPKPGQPRDPANPLIRDYGAKFEVRAWIADLQNWQAQHIEVKEGDTLGGKMTYRNKEGTKVDYDYTNDLGYKFDKVELQDDPNSKIKGVQVEVAILINSKTKQPEMYPKTSNPKARAESLLLLDAIWKEQEEAKKVDLAKRKAGVEKMKADAAARETPQP